MVDEDRPPVEPLEGAALPERDAAQVGVVADAGEDDLGALGGGGRRVGAGVAVLRHPGLGPARGAVVDGDLVPLGRQMPGHRIAHDPEPDECDARHRYPPLTLVALCPPWWPAIGAWSSRRRKGRASMAFLFRWLMRGFLALAALAAAGLALAWYLAGQSLPDYDRSLTLAGPEREIEIVRDRYAVPHVLSETDHDAFFGLGFVHAQDRLWQMTLARRTVQGRLSEIFGPETVGIDRLMRVARPLRPVARGGGPPGRGDDGGARGLFRRGQRLDAGGAGGGARARGAGVLPVHPGDRPVAARQLDRGAEAHGAADDRQGGDGDAQRASLSLGCRRSG